MKINIGRAHFESEDSVKSFKFNGNENNSIVNSNFCDQFSYWLQIQERIRTTANGKQHTESDGGKKRFDNESISISD